MCDLVMFATVKLKSLTHSALRNSFFYFMFFLYKYYKFYCAMLAVNDINING